MSYRNLSEEWTPSAKTSANSNWMTLNGKPIAPEELQQQQAQEEARWRRVIETILLEDEIRLRLKNRELTP